LPGADGWNAGVLTYLQKDKKQVKQKRNRGCFGCVSAVEEGRASV